MKDLYWHYKESLPLNESFFISYCDIDWKWNYNLVKNELDRDGIVFTHNKFHPHKLVNNYAAFCKAKDNQLFEIREKESGGENWIEYDDEGQELTETERDTEGAYMGAPVGTEMPVKTPVRTPTTTPTTPKRRRGPFTRPSVKPKPKAGKEGMPDWMSFDDITSQVENS